MPVIVALLLLQDSASLMEDIGVANDPGKVLLQDQALEKIRRAGAAAVPAILRFVKERGPNAMTMNFTKFLSEFKDERIKALLAELVGDKDFFWRPMAAAALAVQKDPAYRDLFRKHLNDHLWGVREACLVGLKEIGDKESAPAIRKLLADPVYDVRAQAAKALYAFGDETGLPVLVEALRDSTNWFEIDYGQIAREDAWNFLKSITKDDFGFKPWDPEAKRLPGLKRWEEWIAKKFPNWKEMVPETARARPDTARYLFGFELRSCQKGDIFFRVDLEGHLVLGYFTLERRKMSDEDVAAFKEALKKVWEIDREVVRGRPGCDFEKYYLRAEEGYFETVSFGVQGRPGELDGFIRLCEQLMLKYFGEGVQFEFKDRTRLFRELD